MLVTQDFRSLQLAFQPHRECVDFVSESVLAIEGLRSCSAYEALATVQLHFRSFLGPFVACSNRREQVDVADKGAVKPTMAQVPYCSRKI